MVVIRFGMKNKRFRIGILQRIEGKSKEECLGEIHGQGTWSYSQAVYPSMLLGKVTRIHNHVSRGCIA